MADGYRIIGAEMSPYSVKARSYFRYKEIPHCAHTLISIYLHIANILPRMREWNARRRLHPIRSG